MENINILFLGGAKRVSLAEHFIKTGKKLSKQINIFSYELNRNIPISILGKVIIGLKWKDPNILNHLIDTIKENNIHIVLPFVDPAIEVCARLKELNNQIYIPTSGEFICKIMFEKKLSADWFNQNTFPIPQTYNYPNIKYPVIFKPNTGSAAQGLIIVKSPEELINIKNIDDYLIQEYFSKMEEYTVDSFVSKDRKILTIVPRIRLEMAGGEVTSSVTINDQEIIKLSEQILQKGEFIGPITIQFIRNKENNNLYVMEINPRLGGGVILSIEAGANIAEMILKEYLNLPNHFYNNWKVGTYMTRYFKEVIFYADNY